jgi:hypothetical protein
MKIEHTRSLIEAFNNRSLDRHAKSSALESYPGDGYKYYLIYDPGSSRNILTSRAFAGFNYFKPGYVRAKEKEAPLSWIETFFDANLLFEEDEKHIQDKRTLHRLLDGLESNLKNCELDIVNFFLKRKSSVDSAIGFSARFVRVCLGLLISDLLTIPVRRVFKTLTLRENVWFVYFHPLRQRRMNAALEYMCGGESPPGRGDPGYHEYLLAQSLIVMGYDPLVGSICASILDNRGEEFSKGAFRYRATSFVSRICRQEIIIHDIRFSPGDVCFTTLLPAASQIDGDSSPRSTIPSSLAFGAGPHACVGKSISLAMLDIAQHVYLEVFREGFRHDSVIVPDGAFLSFQARHQG